MRSFKGERSGRLAHSDEQSGKGSICVQHQPIGSPSTPFVVPLGGTKDRDGGEAIVVVEAFATHPLLQSAVPGEGVSLSWVSVPCGSSWSVPELEHKSLLIVLEGRAELRGSTNRVVERGDVVSLHPGDAHELADVVGKEFRALQVFFASQTFDSKDESGSAGEVDQVSTKLEELLEKNEALATQVLANPYFRMIQEGGLDSERMRGLFRDRLRVFCDAFQTFLFARQATCDDESYKGIFAEHLLEEIGHNDLMKVTGEKRRFDAVLEATSNWFCHQMLVQDNVGKAAIHLVLETGGDYFHNLAKPAFDSDVSSEYFRTHAEDDERHKQMSIDLLGNQTESTYRRLDQTVVDAWNMIDAMTRRIHRLVQLESSAS